MLSYSYKLWCALGSKSIIFLLQAQIHFPQFLWIVKTTFNFNSFNTPQVQSLSQNVKYTMRSLARQTYNFLSDRISSTHRLPANFLSQDLNNMLLVSEGAFKHSEVLNTVVSRLQHLTQEPDEVNCIRAIEILSVATLNFSIYKVFPVHLPTNLVIYNFLPNLQDNTLSLNHRLTYLHNHPFDLRLPSFAGRPFFWSEILSDEERNAFAKQLKTYVFKIFLITFSQLLPFFCKQFPTFSV